MATIFLPRLNRHIQSQTEVETFLQQWGIPCTRWMTDVQLPATPTQQDVLAAYASHIQPYMASQGYQTADVIHLDANTPNLAELRAKFLQEHTHSEDEVRFFVQGQGDFWYHLSEHPEGLFAVRAFAGDLLAVPEGTRHWFDAGLNPHVTVIRMFTDPDGWIAQFTGDNIADQFTCANCRPQ